MLRACALLLLLLLCCSSAAAQARAQAASSSGDHTWSPVEQLRVLRAEEEVRLRMAASAAAAAALLGALLRRISAAASCRRMRPTCSGSVIGCQRVSTLPLCPLGRVKLWMEEGGEGPEAGSWRQKWESKTKSGGTEAASQVLGGTGVTRRVRLGGLCSAPAPALGAAAGGLPGSHSRILVGKAKPSRSLRSKPRGELCRLGARPGWLGSREGGKQDSSLPCRRRKGKGGPSPVPLRVHNKGSRPKETTRYAWGPDI